MRRVMDSAVDRLRLRSWLSACLLLFVVLPIAAPASERASVAAAVNSIRVETLKNHAAWLASDTLEGREAGTRGGRAAGAYLGQELRKLGLRGGGTDGGYFQEFGSNYRNVIGLLPGSDPDLKHEYIIVGAHYDHVGYGNQGNSFGPAGYIHNGADDNASGTAVLLQIAQACTLLQPPPRRTILFAFWDAEEIGLLGSKHWVGEPTVPLSQVRLMINADMVGRLRKRTLTVYGARTAVGLRNLVCEQNRGTNLLLHFDWDIDADSDHYPFYERRIPFLMLHTEKHEDYHRPSDEFSKLNLEGMQQVARLMFGIAYAAAEQPQLPSFRPAAASEREPQRHLAEQPLPPLRSRLGIAYDQRRANEGVIQITQVAAGSAAARAGLRVGDRILEFAHQPAGDAADFRAMVLAADSPVPILVGRAGRSESLALSVPLDGPPLRLGIAWRTDDALPGYVILSRVVPGSPAALAGLQVNDRICEVDEQRFSSNQEFRELVGMFDESLTFLLERRGRFHHIEVRAKHSRVPTERSARESAPIGAP